jgi:hypothetical protein
MGVEVILDIYSGRENPKWSLEKPAIVELGQLLGAIEAKKNAQLPQPPALGYRGFHLRTFQERLPSHITVFMGAVVTESGNFQDLGRKIEQWLVGHSRKFVDNETYKYLESLVQSR